MLSYKNTLRIFTKSLTFTKVRTIWHEDEKRQDSWSKTMANFYTNMALILLKCEAPAPIFFLSKAFFINNHFIFIRCNQIKKISKSWAFMKLKVKILKGNDAHILAELDYFHISYIWWNKLINTNKKGQMNILNDNSYTLG